MRFFLIIRSLLLLVLLLGATGMGTLVQAQGTIQVQLFGLPAVPSSPFVEDLARNYEQGRYPLQVTFSTPSLQTATVEIQVTLDLDGEQLFAVTSDPFPLQPGIRTYNSFRDVPGLQFNETLATLVEQVPDAGLRRQIRRTGALPEGFYTLTVEVLPSDPFLTALPSVSTFSVRYVQPPIALTPSDGAIVSQTYPLFSWTPVTAPATSLIEYDVLVVEVLPGQTPRQALAGNRAYLNQSVRQTLFAYTPELLPLQTGTTYAWTVTASDVDGTLPISDQGQSEIQTFVYDDPAQIGGSLAGLSEITLEPGFARLTNLDFEAEERATSYALDGEATLELTFNSTVRLRARLDGLEIQKTGLDNPVLLGGAVSASTRRTALPPGTAGELVALESLEWRLGTGFVAEGSVRLPDGRTVEADGTVRLSRAGLRGRLTATNPSGLLSLKSDPVAMTLTDVTAAFPALQLLAQGDLRTFGTDAACAVRDFDLHGGTPLRISCDTTMTVQVVPDSDRMVLSMNGLDGTIQSTGNAADAFSFDLQSTAQLSVATTPESPSCSFITPITVSSTDGVSIGQTGSSCDSEAILDLGLVQMVLANAEIDRLGYQPGGSWDPALTFDARLTMPALGDLSLPRLNGIALDRSGLTVPPATFEQEFQATTVEDRTFEWAGYAVTVHRLDLAETTFPWVSWDGTGPGPWDFTFDATVDFPDDSQAPQCLRNASLQATSFRFQNEALGGTLTAENLGGCRWPLGGGYAIALDRLGGSLSGTDVTDEGFTGVSDVTIDGEIELGEPFQCDAQTPDAVTLPSDGLRLHGRGLSGTLPNILPQCPIGVGPFTAGITQSEILFDYAPRTGQEAGLDAEATLQLPDGQGVDGTVGIDLTTGTFTALDFQLRSPFRWDVPQDDPVLTFQLQQATIGLDGFRVDGRQELQFAGGGTLGTTFDRMVLDLETFRIREGEILFDSGFGLAAGVDTTTGALTYDAVALNHTLQRDPGLLVTLPGQVRIDSTGLRVTGSAAASLQLDRWAPDAPFEAVFSQDFLMGLFPFGVRRGQANLLYEQETVAYVDNSGFHLGAGLLTQALPDRLPLPTEQVAYLQLRDAGGRPVITTQSMPDGTLQIQTRPGQSVDLVVPALQTAGGTPRLAATFTDLRVTANAGTFVYSDGQINATVNGAPIDLNGLGIPVQLRELAYGTLQEVPSVQEGLFLRGNLTLFQQDLGSDGEVVLAINSTGTVQGTIDLPALNQSIALDGGAGQFALEIQSLSGTLNVGPHPGFDADVTGALVLNDPSGTEIGRADATLAVAPTGVSVTQFSASTGLQPPRLDLGALQFDVTGLTALKQFTYDEVTDTFDFRLGLDIQMALALPDDNTFIVPLKQVELSPMGFEIPSQQIHAGTAPALDDTQWLALGPVELRLFDLLLTQDVTVDWLTNPGVSVGGLSGMELSLALRIPGYPSIAGQELTLSGAGFSDGIMTGQLTPFDFLDGTEPRIGLGGTAGLYVSSFSGSLFDDGGTQGFDIDLSGEFDLPDILPADPANPSCSSGTVTFGLSSAGGLEGDISNFAACATFAFGPATVRFPSSTLSLAVDGQGAQQATLDAQAEATIQGVNGNVTGTGTLGLDLITGDITNASIGLTGAFDYGLPANDPIFVLRVQQATLERDGFLISGSGTLMPDGVGVPVQFNQFKVNPLVPEIVSGSTTIQGAFAFEVALSGTPSWQVVSPSAPVSGGAVLRMDVPSNLTIDNQGLTIDGSTTAGLNYQQESYASLTASFQALALQLAPFSVSGGRVEFEEANTTVAYYDNSGFHFDAAGVVVAVLPNRIPLPSEDVAYLQIKDDQDNALVEYEQIQGGYRLNSLTDTQGRSQPLQLVITGVGAQGNHPQADITLTDLEVNDTFQQVTSGQIDAQVDLNLEQYDIPIRLTALRYEADAQTSTYSLTADGSATLPQGLGGQEATFTDVGFTPDGPQGLLTLGATPFAPTCSALPGGFTPQTPVASVAYTGGQINAQPNAAAIEGADLAVNLRAVKFELNPTGPDTYALLGDVSSRLTADPSLQNAVPDRLPFIAGYANGTWTAELCTDPLPDDPKGNNKLSILLAELYLDSNNGGSATLEITQQGDVDLLLSGTLYVEEAMGGDFGVTVQDLRLGTSGVSVAQAGGQAQGQEFTLFGGNVRARNDQFTFAWDNGIDAFVLSLDGTLWVVPYMCTPQNDGPAACDPTDAAQFSSLSVDTRGNVGLGAASVDLLGAQQEIAVIGSEQNPNLAISELLLEKRQNETALSLGIGGEATLPDIMEGATSSFGFRFLSDGTVSTDDPLSFQFGDGSDRIGDNSGTEISLENAGTMDVKEIGIGFENSDPAQIALYANGAAYIKPQSNSNPQNVVHFGQVGGTDASTAGLYYKIGTTPAFNVNGTVTLPDLDFEFFAVRNANVQTATTANGFALKLGGDLSLSVPGVAGVGARWERFTIDKTGVSDPGGVGPNGATFEVISIVSLQVGTIDFSQEGGTVTVDGETIDTETHFVFGGAQLSLPSMNITGGVGGAYYLLDTEGGLRVAVENANVGLPTFAATLTFNYMKDGQDFAFLAAGGMSLDGIGAVGLAGAFANVNDEIAFGLVVSVETTQGIPLFPPNVITLSGVSGGFFYNPTVSMMELALGSCTSGQGGVLPAFAMVPDEYRFDHCDATAVNDITVAAFIGASARVLDAGVPLMEATAMITFATGSGGQALELAVEGSYFGISNLKGALAVNVKIGSQGANSEVNGFAGVQVLFDPAANGEMNVGFYVLKSQNQPVVWAIEGHAEVSIVALLDAEGDFLVCNDGLIMSLGISQGFDIWIIAIRSEMEMEFWKVFGTTNYGAYFEVGIRASVLGGIAELGAEAKGAYINRDQLFYAGARGYLRVGCVFGACVYNGNLSVWMSFKKGEGFDGGEGSNSRYKRMIDDARQDAQDMVEKAENAKNALDEARDAAQNQPFQFTEAQIQAAGIELVGSPLQERAAYGQTMLSNENQMTGPSGPLNLLRDIESDIISGGRTSYGNYIPDKELEVQLRQLALQITATPVAQRLGDLTAEAIAWNAEAADLSENLSSPLTSYSQGSFSGSGENKTITSQPSFQVDSTKAADMENTLTEFKDGVASLDAQYRASINAVARNLDKLSTLMTGEATAWFFFSFSTSANDVATQYATLATDVQDLYAARADSLWRTRKWAQDHLTDFQSGGPYSSAQITSSMNALYTRLRNNNQYQRAANVAAERQRLILDFGNDPNLSDTHNQYTSTVNGYASNQNAGPLGTEFTNMGRYLWHDVPEAGLSAYADTLRLRAEANPARMDAKLNPILANYRRFTQSIDTLYVIKSNMATTLYGMLEEYRTFRETAFRDLAQDDTLATYTQYAQDLIVKLRPPRLTRVYVSRSYDASAYKRKVQVYYSASHDAPEGVVEASVSPLYGSSSTSAYAGSDRFYTIGDATDASFWLYKETAGETTEDFSVAIRVRGPAGVTQTRRVSTTATVDPSGPSNGRGWDGNELETDTTPPSAIVSLDYQRADVAEGSASGGPLFQVQQQTPSLFGGTGQPIYTVSPPEYTEAYWTRTNNELAFNVLATDAESDIRGHEYAIGRSKGATDVRNWSEAVGTRSLAGDNQGGLANVSFSGIARGLQLEAQTPYYVSVRVINGDLLSKTKELDVPLVYDDTPPSAPGRANNELSLASLQSESSYYRSRKATGTPPSYAGPATSNDTPERPHATVRWNQATDAQSGIDYYQYAVHGTTVDSSTAFDDPEKVSTTRGTRVVLDDDDGLSFFSADYVYVRAINHAGAPGELLRIGPIRPVDPTRPLAPSAQVMPTVDGIRVYLRQAAADPESKIKGYQYRIQKSSCPGCHDGWARDWPQGTSTADMDATPQCGSADTGGNGSGGGLFGGGQQSQNQTIVVSQQATQYDADDLQTQTLLPGELTATGCSIEYSGTTAPYFTIPWSGLPSDIGLLVHVRAVNYQGEHNAIHVRSGPVYRDATQAPQPTLRADWYSLTDQLAFSATNVRDPESGILKIEWRYKQGSSRSPWQTLQSYYGVQTAATDVESSATISGSSPTSVEIRITNGAGREAVYSTSVGNPYVQQYSQQYQYSYQDQQQSVDASSGDQTYQNVQTVQQAAQGFFIGN